MMKRYLISSIVAIAAAGAAAPAFAQEGPNRDSHFDGPYISGFVGMGLQNNDGGDGIVFDAGQDGSYGDTITLASPPAAPGTDAFGPGYCNGFALGPTPGDGCRGDKDKIEYGVRLGYDKRMGNNFVLGGLIEASRNNSRDGSSGFSTTPARYAFDRKLDHALSARLRAGYTPGGGALFYATGGASWAKIDHGFATNNAANSFTEVRNGKRVWGWQAGGGAEVMLTDSVSLGLEYLYNRYNDDKYYVAVGTGTAPATNPFVLAGGANMRPSDTRFDFHSVRAAVSFQF